MDTSNFCMSGGAQGADIAWGEAAIRMGHTPIHFSFEGHRTRSSPEHTIVLNEKQLSRSNVAVLKAARSLKRNLSSHAFVRNLIRRNYYQVEIATSAYAVSRLSGDYVDGGTAWALAMLRNRDENIPQYVFCQDENGWFEWDGMWVASKPPKPTGVWAGIGTRNLSLEGQKAISDLCS